MTITYDTGGLYFFLNLFRVYGSVFPKAFVVSFPSCLVSAGFVATIHDWNLFDEFKDPESVMNNNAIWGGFSFLVGFLVVFRTSQAYNRFWEGCTQMHKMGAEWFDSCSSLMAFCKHADVDPAMVDRFRNLLIRLFSMLHAAALGEIEDCGTHHDYMEVQAFNMELIDAESVDSEALAAIRDSDAKVELIFQWIQQLVVENIKTGVLSIPPPILSRSFQEIATGMVHFHEAMKISNVPFPFPYAQTCDCLLMFHWVLVPFISSQWVTKAWWAGIFSFIQVFTFWTLNLIAVELENPFGTDPNDIDGAQMQLEMNNHLRLLIRPETWKTPVLSKAVAQNADKLTLKAYMCEDYYHMEAAAASSTSSLFRGRERGEPQSTFHKIWKHMDDGEDPVRRYSTATSHKKKSARGGKRSSTRKYGSTESMMEEKLNTVSTMVSAQTVPVSAGSVLLSEYTDKTESSKNSQGLPKNLNIQSPNMKEASPVTHEAQRSFVQQEHRMANGQDVLQQGTWEPYPDGMNGRPDFQTPTGPRNMNASPETMTPTPYSREISESYQGAFANDENALQMRLGEIFDQLDSGFHPNEGSDYEGRWEDTQESPRQKLVAIPSPMHMTRPPSEPSSEPSLESEGGRKELSDVDSDAMLGHPAPIMVPPPAVLLRPLPKAAPPLAPASHRTFGKLPSATLRNDANEVSPSVRNHGSPARQTECKEPCAPNFKFLL